MTLTLSQPGADVFVPDGVDVASALRRTTHLAVGAHQDDLEIMAAHGVSECFRDDSRWFTGVVVTDGAGSPRAHAYESYTDEQMMATRRLELSPRHLELQPQPARSTKRRWRRNSPN
jgi:hypothetical protein